MASAHRYVRALYDFNTAQLGEIELMRGDVIELLHTVDDNWLCGNLFGKVGNFPSSYVEYVDTPVLEGREHLYAAIKSFNAEEPGDLGFKKGDLIVGYEAVDQNWWRGRLGNRDGIFPITHVYHLTAGETSSCTPTKETLPQLPPEQGDKQVIARAVASMDLAAQFDELGFKKGDVIDIYKAVDEDFAIGECQGRTGSFPLSFVEIFEGDLDVKPEKKEKRKSKMRWWEDEKKSEPKTKSYGSESNGGNSHGYSSQPVVEQSQVESRNLKREPSHDAPKTTYQHSESRSSYTTENTRSHDSELTPYGKVLFQFIAENSNELTLLQNDIVNLKQHVDDQWIEGELNGKRGIFPASFIEVIVDCPWASSSSSVSTAAKTSTPDTALSTVVTKPDEKHVEPQKQTEVEVTTPDVLNLKSFPPDTYGFVLYDFTAETPQDLSLKKGDTVTLLHQMDDFWYEARHDDGRVGFCPIDYVEVIGSEPAKVEASTEKVVSGEPVSTSTVPSSVPASVSSSVPSSVSPSQQTSSVPEKTKPLKPPLPAKLKSQGQSKPNRMSLPADFETKSATVLPKVSPQTAKPTTSKPFPNLGPPPAIPARARDDQKAGLARSDTMPVQPVATSNTSTTSSRAKPVIARAVSVALDSELDSLIEGKLHEARNRTSSVASDSTKPRSLSQSSAGQQQPQSKRLSSSSAADWSKWTSDSFNVQLQSPTDKSSKEKRVAFSKFYDTAATPSSPPARPSQPPPTARALHRQGSGRLVPQRPAPPRPAAPTPGADLMAFSPTEHEQEDMEENSEVIADLDKRIAEVEADLQRYSQQRDEVTRLLESEEGGLDESAQEQAAGDKDFCEANINGLTEELRQLKEDLYSVCPSRLRADQQQQQRTQQRAQQQREEAERQRRQEEQAKAQHEEVVARHKDQRQRVIQEILQTEKDYLHSLSLVMETFQGKEFPAGIDKALLFGNMAEVTELSQNLLTKLEEATAGKEFDEQIIGECFVGCKKEMKEVYAPYCRNHDDVIAMLEKYEDDEEVQDFFNQHLDTMRQQCTVFDLGSILIKPVQRILKYPLLLNELIKNTEEEHPDKMHLLAAINCMTDVAAAINEFKRRKDLVRKYREDGDTKLSDKFAKLNVHSTKKKFIRLSQKMVGIQTQDPDYNREEKKFKCVENAVKLLVRDVAHYLDQLQDAVCGEEALANDISDFYGAPKQTEVDKFCRVHNQIAARLYPQFRSEVQQEVLKPLQRLLELLEAPQKVMKKRYDKLLDYDNLNSRVEGQDGAVEREQARATYMALNDQLLDELPQLYSMSRHLLQLCVRTFTRAQQRFYHAALTEMYQMLGLQLVLGTEDGSIVEAFNIAHVQAVDSISSVSFIPKAFNPRMEEKRPKSGRKSTEPCIAAADKQSDSQRQYVRQLYGAGALYVVNEDYAGGAGLMMELPTPRGMLVGLIKEGDPMGNKERCYVDNGAAKGFVPKKILQPASSSSPSQSKSSASQSSSSTAATDLLGVDIPTVSSASPVSWNQNSLMDFPQSSTPPTDQSQHTLQPSPIFNQSGAVLQPSPVFNQSGNTLQPPASQSGARLQPSPVFNQSGSILQPTSSQSPSEGRSRNNSPRSEQSDGGEGSSPGMQPRGVATPAPPEDEMYQAVYDFASRTALELTIHEGELLQVVQQHDTDGNTDWWLAVNEKGQRGYIPCNYVYKVEG